MNLEVVYRRDRAIVLAAVLAVTGLAWVYMYQMAPSSVSALDGSFCIAPLDTAWTPGNLLVAFVMWVVMMIGMMIPTASPMIVMFATTNRRYRRDQGPFVPTAIFVAGYVIVWAGYGVAATLAQWSLHSASLLAPDELRATPAIGGLLFIVAGLFQWSALKRNCLRHCRTPLSFLMTEWREGARGALFMGLRHGTYCAGCCWAIMALMFVAGAMNLLWTAVLAAFMLIEKVAPARYRIEDLAGVSFLAAGTGMVLSATA